MGAIFSHRLKDTSELKLNVNNFLGKKSMDVLKNMMLGLIYMLRHKSCFYHRLRFQKRTESLCPQGRNFKMASW